MKSKFKSFVTDTTYWERIDSKKVKKQFKSISTGRIDHRTIAQLIFGCRYAMDLEQALNKLFYITTTQLTKRELELAQFCYRTGEAQYIDLLLKRNLSDDKFSNNLKIVAEIKKYITKHEPPPTLQSPTLTLNLSPHNTQPPTNTDDDNTNPHNLKNQPSIDLTGVTN